MSPLLRHGQRLFGTRTGSPCDVRDFLGGGGQGEVYSARFAGQYCAVKWYPPAYHRDDSNLRARLERLIEWQPLPSEFTWPIEIVHDRGKGHLFGYVMPLRDPRFSELVDLIADHVAPSSYRVLTTVCFNLAHAFRRLHAAGLCYRDIKDTNICFDSFSGDVLIHDTDNVDTPNSPGVMAGSSRWMAPEIMQGQLDLERTRDLGCIVQPNVQTDLFSLAVLLFWLLIRHHPLEGRLALAFYPGGEVERKERLYGKRALFIFDPNDGSNAPDPAYQPNPGPAWDILPPFIQRLFIRAFSAGMHDPERRVTESEWRIALVRLRDAHYRCTHCGVDLFFNEVTDADSEYPHARSRQRCWGCGQFPDLPPRLVIDDGVVMLGGEGALFPHHIDNWRPFDFTAPVARLTPDGQSLMNASPLAWTVALPSGANRSVAPGEVFAVEPGAGLHVGSVRGVLWG